MTQAASTTGSSRRSGAIRNAHVRGSAKVHGFLDVYLRNRFGVLFYFLLLTFAVSPLLSLLGFSTNLIEWFLSFTLIAAVVPFGGHRTRRVLIVVAVLLLALKVLASWTGTTSLRTAELSLWTVASLIAAFNALRFALRATSVNLECLYAALSAYLLAGVATGVFYWLIESSWPGSLAVSGESLPARVTITQAIYFSFVTLATLGYGDVLPHSELARGVAVLEAVVGQLYLAVMIARLVSLYVMSAGRPGQPGNGNDRGGPPSSA
jgi:hypothetical protein